MTPAENHAFGARWLAAFADHTSGGWAPGMRVMDGEPGGTDPCLSVGRSRVVEVRDGCVTVAWVTDAGSAEGGTLLRDDVPDLSDPATIGAATGLLREVYDDPTGYVQPGISVADGSRLYLPQFCTRMRATGAQKTESEALIRAAESRPRREL